MPKVHVTCNHEWLQAGLKGEGTEQANNRHRLMVQLIQDVLPQAVANAVSEVDGTNLSLSDIIVIPDRFHPAAYNAPVVEIDIQPGNGRARRKKTIMRRRQAIYTSVHERVRAFLQFQLRNRGDEEFGAEFITVDYECRPIGGSGGSFRFFLRDCGEEKIVTWG